MVAGLPGAVRLRLALDQEAGVPRSTEWHPASEQRVKGGGVDIEIAIYLERLALII